MFKLNMSFFRIRKYSTVFQDFCEDQSDLLLNDTVQFIAKCGTGFFVPDPGQLFRSIVGILFQKCFCPVRVRSGPFVLPEIPGSFPVHDRGGEDIHLRQKAGREHGKSHDFDQADVFLFNMVQLLVGMENAQRILL